MYTRTIVPLDGSQTAEKVLPYARRLARGLNLPVELLQVIDILEIGKRLPADKVGSLTDILENVARRGEQYLRGVAATFAGLEVKCTVEKGTAAEVIIDRAATDKQTLISMATHGWSGFKRWLLGSVAEKVLRSTANPLLLIRATEEAKAEGEASLKSVIVPLDGSELAEQALPTAAELAKRLGLEVILFRAYTLPYSATALDPEAYVLVTDEEFISALRAEAVSYLEKKTAALKERGVEKVSYVAEYGLAADEIISLGRKTPDNLIAMSSHGYSGVKRWVLGSVTETVVRHSYDPVLVIRAS